MFISSYYFRSHTYTIVPRHVREDMQWMAECGTDAVIIGVLEQDLYAAVENYGIICEEAHRAGMQVFATPSRWGGLVAGCPKVPSIFSATNPKAMSQKSDGTPFIGWLGPIASVHHPATFDFFCQSLETLFRLFPITGIVWDEVKNLGQRDYSPAARRALAGEDIDDLRSHVDATAGFFDRVGAEILRMQPQTRIGMFLFANLKGYAVERCATIRHLHDFGCDGRPFRAEDRGISDSGGVLATKLLCETGAYFVDIARRCGKAPLFLIENHAMAEQDVPTMDKRLPEVLALGPEHLIYYYYPRSLKDPDRNMAVIARHIQKQRALRGHPLVPKLTTSSQPGASAWD